ncbi:MAG: hypothetical protein M1483_02570 [Actinobacteria bacterium]|nr:hypothetical protein [Actinomycetota bacterium]MCL6104509.1 hypothetical protein [Actinomycetota bacterium]
MDVNKNYDTGNPGDTSAVKVQTWNRNVITELEAELSGVEHALTRLEKGIYDTCEQCGNKIDLSEIQEDPLITRCQQHRGCIR